ncbi:MAG: ATP-binding protein [Bacteroidota bacterium]
MDPKGHFIDLSDRFARMLGEEKERILHQRVENWIHEEDLSIFQQMNAYLSQAPHGTNCQLRWTGLEQTVLTRVAFRRETQDGLIYLVAEDMEIEAKQNQQLLRTLEQLRLKNQELEELAFIASHNLREPVRSVVSFTQLLARKLAGQLDEESRDYLEFIQTGAFRMHKLLEGILRYASIVYRNPQPQLIDSKRLLDRVLSKLSTIDGFADVQFEIAELPDIYADEKQFFTVFFHLLSNAMLHNSNQTPRICVKGRWLAKEKSWCFEIQDNGAGIPDAYHEKAFQMFQRLATDDDEQLGIGLSICRRVIQNHGGQIFIDSQHEKGTRLVCQFPDPRLVEGDISPKKDER